MPIKRILIAKTGETYYVKDISKDYHTKHGFIKVSDLKKKKGRIISNMKKEFYIFEPAFIDSYMKIKRGPQIVSRKDLAMIIAETGINKESIVVDTGSGSGAVACFLANITKKVYTYDIRDDFISIVKKNIDFLGLKNVEVKKHDVYAGIPKKNIDLVFLDLPEPWNVIEHARKSLKPGGFLVSYSPTIPQTADFVNEIKKTQGLIHIKTIESIQREWEIEARKVRPFSRMTGHTGFLSFARRIL